MKLQELFKKATPRPWEARQHSDGSHWFVDAQIGGEGYTIIDELDEKTAVLIALAVNNFEGLRYMLIRLTEKVERANSIQHSGGEILPEDWSELHSLTHEARGVLHQAEEVEG